VTPNITIVGVVKDTKQSHVRDGSVAYIYYPYSQDKRLTGMTFYVRTQQDPLLLANGLRGEVQHLDANLPVYDLKTFERVVNEDLFAERMVAGLSASFGGLAALLAALGSTAFWRTWWWSERGRLGFGWRWEQGRGMCGF